MTSVFWPQTRRKRALNNPPINVEKRHKADTVLSVLDSQQSFGSVFSEDDLLAPPSPPLTQLTQPTQPLSPSTQPTQPFSPLSPAQTPNLTQSPAPIPSPPAPTPSPAQTPNLKQPPAPSPSPQAPTPSPPALTHVEQVVALLDDAARIIITKCKWLSGMKKDRLVRPLQRAASRIREFEASKGQPRLPRFAVSKYYTYIHNSITP